MDDLNEGTSTDGEMIVTKTEIEFGDQSCQTTQGGTSTYGDTTIDYGGKSHQRMAYDDPGPSSVQPHNDQWLDEKHFMTPQSQSTNTSGGTTSSNEDGEQQRCKTKNYKALEPCSCPLCARVYSNVSNLRQHMRLIHNPTSVCCPLCQKSFTSDLYLKRHYLSMHGSTIPTQTVTSAQQTNPNATQLQTTQSGTQQSQSSQAQQQVCGKMGGHATKPHIIIINAILNGKTEPDLFTFFLFCCLQQLSNCNCAFLFSPFPFSSWTVF